NVTRWWASMNPAWRPRNKAGLLVGRGTGSDWGTLRCSGQNGLQTVLRALSWWHAWDSSEEGRMSWEEITRDVSWALDEMLKGCR
ncbi:hypothetical protein HDZ31DRAFT_50823, partial [Schizophyllum fasciatum]